MSTALSGTVEDNDDDTIVTVDESGSTLATLNSSEIFQQIATAKKYPRSMTQFMKQLETLATVNEEVAQQCVYAVPRGGKQVIGKSIRLAELAVACWKNVRTGYRQVDEDDRFVTCQAYCYDLENNIFIQVEAKRRITYKNGDKFDDDMVGVTTAACCSIALRNAVLRIIPGAFIEPVFTKCRRVIKGDEKTLTNRIEVALGWFKQSGVSEELVMKAIGRTGRADITTDDLVTLTGMKTAITTGESSIEKMFDYEANTTKKARQSSLNDKIGEPKKPETTEQAFQRCLAEIAGMDAKAALEHIKTHHDTENWTMDMSRKMDDVLEGKAK